MPKIAADCAARLDLLERQARPGVAEALAAARVRASRSISASAWPELTPGAAAPLISADRNRLKWLITCGAVVSRTRTTLASGTISPLVVRA